MTKPRGWWHDEAVELARDGWTVAEIAEEFGVSKQAVYAPLDRAGVETEAMRRRREAEGDPMITRQVKFETAFVERVERHRKAMQRERPGRRRVAWAEALRALAEEALEGRGRR